MKFHNFWPLLEKRFGTPEKKLLNWPPLKILPTPMNCTDWLSFSHSVRRTRSCRYCRRGFLFCDNVWLLCCVTIPQFCHNARWRWRNTPELLH